MNQEKVGQFIKNIRKQNNLTQNEFAKKYNVTYQAVSKWENGKNLPDVSLIKQICKDYNMDINELLDGEYKKKKNTKLYIILTIILIILSIFLIYILNNDDFNFKTLSSGCNNFTISGSISYNNKKSSIYISNINYCGEKNEQSYKKIECGLYEKQNDTEVLISTSNYEENKLIKLDEFLKKLEFTIENYNTTCKDYSNESLFLRIKAQDKKNETTIYEIPLTLKDC